MKFAKKKDIRLNAKCLGRSDWIRTSGHLNPIQVLYQTEPHPEITCTSIHQKTKVVKAFLKIIQKENRAAEDGSR